LRDRDRFVVRRVDENARASGLTNFGAPAAISIRSSWFLVIGSIIEF
jgi:hypothetical protein